MKPLVAAALFVALAAPPAAAANSAHSRLEPAFKGTIVSTYPDGRTAKLWLNADGTYRGVGRRRLPSSGVWSVKGEKVCLKQKKPRAAPFAYCTPMPQAGAGKSWTGRAVTGERIRISVVPGR